MPFAVTLFLVVFVIFHHIISDLHLCLHANSCRRPRRQSMKLRGTPHQVKSRIQAVLITESKVPAGCAMWAGWLQSEPTWRRGESVMMTWSPTNQTGFKRQNSDDPETSLLIFLIQMKNLNASAYNRILVLNFAFVPSLFQKDKQ